MRSHVDEIEGDAQFAEEVRAAYLILDRFEKLA